MSIRIGTFVVIAVVVLAGSSAAVAQTPAPGNAQMLPRRVMDSAFALGAAYREIGRAEQASATGHYIDAARTHYRSAIDRHARNDDAGAAAEARLASDLARVALDERPAVAQTGPKDVPAPPTPRPGTGRMPDGGPMMIDGMRPGMPGMPGMDGPGGRTPMIRISRGDGFRIGHRGVDAAALAEILKVETSAEARQLAQNAVDANASAQKAALAGNVAEAARQTRIADDLVAAVHDLAALNHPELRHQTIEMRMMSTETMTR